MGGALRDYQASLNAHSRNQLLWRMNLQSRGQERDDALLGAVFAFLKESRTPYEGFWFDWYGGESSAKRAMDGPRSSRYEGPLFSRMRSLIGEHPPAEPARIAHPYFKRDDPCSMEIEAMEATWDPIAKEDDWSALDSKLRDIRTLGEALGTRKA